MKNQSNSKQQTNSFSDIIIVVGMLFFALIIFLAKESIGDGSYESSLYDGYPAVFWGGVVFTLLLGFTQVFLILIKFPNSYRWLLGFGLIVVVNIFVVSLPYFRDYMFSGSWDSPNHHSFILNIVETGFPFSEDFYPVSHLIAAVFSIISDQSIAESMHLTSISFYFIGIMNMFLLAWVYDSNPRVRGVLLVISSIPVYFNYQTMFFPVLFSTYMVVFFVSFFLISRKKGRNWKEVLIFIITIIFLPYLHPLAVVVPLFFLVTYLFPIITSKHPSDESPFRRFSRAFQKIYPGFLILLAGWFLWFVRFRAFGKTVSQLVLTIRDGLSGFNSLESFISASERANLGFVKVLPLIFFTYGSAGGVVLIALVLLIILFFSKPRKGIIFRADYLAFPIFMIIFLTIAVSSLFRDLITSNPHRYLNFSVVLSPLVIGPVLNYLLESNLKIFGRRSRNIVLGFVPISIFAVAVLSIFNLFYSPLTGQPNNQYSYARAAGAEFLLNNADDEVGGIYSISARERIFRGVRSTQDVVDLLSENKNWDVKIPPVHFGYDDGLPPNDNSFDNPEYFFITGYGTAYYSDYWPSGGRYTPGDFDLLENDPSWNRVYQSGDFTLWVWRIDD